MYIPIHDLLIVLYTIKYIAVKQRLPDNILFMGRDSTKNSTGISSEPIFTSNRPSKDDIAAGKLKPNMIIRRWCSNSDHSRDPKQMCFNIRDGFFT